MNDHEPIGPKEFEKNQRVEITDEAIRREFATYATIASVVPGETPEGKKVWIYHLSPEQPKRPVDYMYVLAGDIRPVYSS